MRSPGAAFDLRSALVEEVRNAVEIFESNPTKPKTIHRCRIALKRARALGEVGNVSAPGLADIFDESARGIMRTLGNARDNWVLERSARSLADQVGKKARKELKALADRVDAFQRTAPPLNVESVRGKLKDLLALAQVWPDASPRQVERGARRVARRARKVWREARKGEGELRHKWRKREKERLYAAALLSDAWPEGQPPRRKHNSALGDTLGDERDLLLVMERLAADHPVNGRPRALRDLAKERRRLAKRADKLGRRVHARGA